MRNLPKASHQTRHGSNKSEKDVEKQQDREQDVTAFWRTRTRNHVIGHGGNSVRTRKGYARTVMKDSYVGLWITK